MVRSVELTLWLLRWSNHFDLACPKANLFTVLPIVEMFSQRFSPSEFGQVTCGSYLRQKQPFKLQRIILLDKILQGPCDPGKFSTDVKTTPELPPSKLSQQYSRWWFQVFFIFTPIWGMIQFDYSNIFERGWNHQLVFGCIWSVIFLDLPWLQDSNLFGRTSLEIIGPVWSCSLTISINFHDVFP